MGLSGREELMERDRRVLKKMPDRKLLEDFINGLSSTVKVVFNIEKGEFERTRPEPDPNSGKPKTPEGRRISKL